MSRSDYKPENVPTLEQLYPDVRQDKDEAWTFWVWSSNGSVEYKVQLNLYNWNGWCGCQNFEFACWPELTRGALPDQRLKCKHIRRARDFYLDKIGRESEQLLKR